MSSDAGRNRKLFARDCDSSIGQRPLIISEIGIKGLSMDFGQILLLSIDVMFGDTVHCQNLIIGRNNPVIFRVC
jgi:hypothetical protein